MQKTLIHSLVAVAEEASPDRLLLVKALELFELLGILRIVDQGVRSVALHRDRLRWSPRDALWEGERRCGR